MRSIQKVFMASLINVHDKPYPQISMNGSPVTWISSSGMNSKLSMKYQPNIESIRNHNAKMVTATGRDSDDAYYVQTTRALAARLGRENVEFPGHHDVSFWMPEEFPKLF